MDIFPHLRVTEYSFGHSPSASPNYVTSPLPSPTVPSSRERWVPRICHGVERSQRSRPSSRAAAQYPKLTRGERSAIKHVSSRRWDDAEDAPPISSSSLWVSPVLAANIPTKYPPRPTIISDEHSPSATLRGAYGSLSERDASPGFDGDIESGDTARCDQRSSSGANERLTIVVPGGKSEAYVAMAFERSCSLTDDDRADHHASYIFPTTLPPPPPPTRHQQYQRQAPGEERRARRTGLKIRIPAPNPLLLLSLRLADSCRITGIDVDTSGGDDEDGDDEDSGACTSPELGYTSPCSSTSGVGSGVLQGPFVHYPVLEHRDVSTQESRVARRITHRNALAPYAIDHSRACTNKRRLVH